jgi:NADH-quinone oxidoreductase subunit L
MPSLGLMSAGGEQEVGSHFDWSIAIISTLLALTGAGLAFVLYGRGVEKLPAALEPVFALSRDRLYVEEAYEAALVKPAVGLAFLAKVFDGFLDGLARLISALPRFLGQLTRPVQNGHVQFYSLSMALGLIVLITFAVFRITR